MEPGRSSATTLAAQICFDLEIDALTLVSGKGGDMADTLDLTKLDVALEKARKRKEYMEYKRAIGPFPWGFVLPLGFFFLCVAIGSC